MFSLFVENDRGEKLELTHNPAYVVEDIDGLGSPDVVINTTRNAGSDGSTFNSSYLDNREITITLAVNYPAEENRINLYRYLKAKRAVRLWYQNGLRDVYIDGYVKNVTPAMFQQKEIVQATVLCVSPCWKSKYDTIITFGYVEGNFEFAFDIGAEGIPFSILRTEATRSVYNDSDVNVGAIITLFASGNVSHPVVSLETGETFGVDVSLADGDRLVINTRPGERSVHKVAADATVTNCIGDLDSGSSWFMLAPGDNVINVSATSGSANLQTVISVLSEFEGV